MSHRKYTIEDFALDPKFRKWIFDPSGPDNDYWTDWIEKHPDKKPLLIAARKLLLQYPMVEYTIAEEKLEAIWEAVSEHLEAPSTLDEKERQPVYLNAQSILYAGNDQKRIAGWRRPTLLAIAATLAVALGMIYFTFVINDTKNIRNKDWIVRKNPWGQKSAIHLEDGSRVILNAGSTLTYSDGFDGGKREFWLKGEAYFQVAKSPMPFSVHTQGLTTTALGTEFNIAAYEGEPVQVSLVEGKVKVSSSGTGRETLYLNPGEAVRYHPEDLALGVVPFDPDHVLGWKNHVLSFYQSDEEEVITSLERWYGVKILSTNASKQPWSYTGRFKKQSLEEVLMSVSFAMGFSYHIDNDTVTITYR